jgi:hypothetical protein
MEFAKDTWLNFQIFHAKPIPSTKMSQVSIPGELKCSTRGGANYNPVNRLPGLRYILRYKRV